TALAKAFAQWTGEKLLLLDLERDGRECLFENINLSRTVGWFNSVFPIQLDLTKSIGIGGELKAIKEQIRHVPNRGIGYGLLQYFSEDPGTIGKLDVFPRPEVAFSYTVENGRSDFEPGWFIQAWEGVGSPPNLSEKRRYLLEIRSSIRQERLWTSWTYGSNL